MEKAKVCSTSIAVAALLLADMDTQRVERRVPRELNEARLSSAPALGSGNLKK
ncbi:MAG: hypothetical protein ROZ36_13525 [Thermincola sp.]|jgi:hypothetical protein|nr:hypothetical protein [Thermincola sp.]